MNKEAKIRVKTADSNAWPGSVGEHGSLHKGGLVRPSQPVCQGESVLGHVLETVGLAQDQELCVIRTQEFGKDISPN